MKKTISILFAILLFSGCTINIVTSEEESENLEQPEENTVEETQPEEKAAEEDTKETAYWEHTQTSDEAAVIGLYEGRSAAIKGWTIKKDFYNTETTFFHVSEESFKDLPVEIQNLLEERPKDQFQDCHIQKNDEDMINKLPNSSISNPITIVIDKIRVPMEGAITLNLAEIL